MAKESWMGGCQCGAVRYELTVRPDKPCICHCRMCQKQFGNFFGSFAGVDLQYFKLLRGQIKYFKSSDHGERGFCGDCSTPLAYRSLESGNVSVSIGSLDRHSEMQPVVQYGVEAREPWFALLANLPASETGKNPIDDPKKYESIKASNRQHPDH